MADMEASSTIRSGNDLVDNTSTAVSTTHKQAAAGVSCSDVRGSSLGFHHPDSMTVPSDNTTATTTSENGPAATNNAVAAAAALPLRTKPTAAGADLSHQQTQLCILVWFSSADDRNRLETFLRRSAKLGYRASSATFASICDDTNHQLFRLLGCSGTAGTWYIRSFLLSVNSITVFATEVITTNCQTEPLVLMTVTS